MLVSERMNLLVTDKLSSLMVYHVIWYTPNLHAPGTA